MKSVMWFLIGLTLIVMFVLAACSKPVEHTVQMNGMTLNPNSATFEGDCKSSGGEYTHSEITGGETCSHAGQSWDQENLKKNDSGCPTAIFDAPGGNLRQCP